MRTLRAQGTPIHQKFMTLFTLKSGKVINLEQITSINSTADQMDIALSDGLNVSVRAPEDIAALKEIVGKNTSPR